MKSLPVYTCFVRGVYIQIARSCLPCYAINNDNRIVGHAAEPPDTSNHVRFAGRLCACNVLIFIHNVLATSRRLGSALSMIRKGRKETWKKPRWPRQMFANDFEQPAGTGTDGFVPRSLSIFLFGEDQLLRDSYDKLSIIT